VKVYGPQQRVLIALTAFGFLSILPFAVLRLLQGDVAVSAMDFLMSLLLLAVCLHVIVTGRVLVSGFIVATCGGMVALATIHLRGADQAYWIFPAVLAIYYLIPSRTALGLATLVSIAAILLIAQTHDLLDISTIVATLFITNIFAYVFSRSTEQKASRLEDQATTGELTRTGNRRALKDRLQEIVLAQGRARDCDAGPQQYPAQRSNPAVHVCYP